MPARAHLSSPGTGWSVIALLATHAGLLWLHDLAGRPWWTLVLTLTAFAALVPLALGGARRLGVPLLLGLAVVLRLLLVPLPPTLSDDVLRYLWDGKVVTNGSNPYALVPDAVELSGLRDERWERMPHRDVEAVYPPFALGLFSIAASAPRPEIAWKVLLVAVELVGAGFFLAWGRRRGIGDERLALYLWNPLVTLEVAGMGHVDGAGVALLMIGVWALDRRPVAAAVALAGAVLVKLVPLALLPFWARRAARRRSFVLTVVLLLAAVLVPLFASVGGAPPGWVRFGVSWEFNGPLYEPLWRGFDRVDADLLVKGGLDRLKSATGRHEFWNRFYPGVYPQLLAKGVLALGLCFWLARLWRDRSASLAAVTGRSFAAVILFSATVYPWYLLWVLPWAAAALHPGWLLLTATIQLSYLPQHLALPLFPWLFSAIWIPPLVLSWRRGAWSMR